MCEELRSPFYWKSSGGKRLKAEFNLPPVMKSDFTYQLAPWPPLGVCQWGLSIVQWGFSTASEHDTLLIKGGVYIILCGQICWLPNVLLFADWVLTKWCNQLLSYMYEIVFSQSSEQRFPYYSKKSKKGPKGTIGKVLKIMCHVTILAQLWTKYMYKWVKPGNLLRAIPSEK